MSRMADAAFTQAAREHFGALTPLHAYGRAAQAMAEVSRGSTAGPCCQCRRRPMARATTGGPRCCRTSSRGLHIVAD